MRYYSFILILVALFTNLNAKNLEVKLVANNWCPQHCIDNKKSPGYLVEIAQASLDAMKIKHTLTIEPWLRAVYNVKNGTYDGLLTPAQSEEKILLRHTIPLASQRFCFYKKKSTDFILNELHDFNNKRIAYVKGNNLGKEFMSYIQNKKNNIKINELISNNSEFAPRIFSFLLKERADAVAITEDMGDYYLGLHKDMKKLVKKSFCTQKELLHVGLNPTNLKRSKEISAILDKGLTKIKKNGTYDKILEKYFLKN